MIIFLIGMPGSGKTSIGKALSIETGFPLIDLDAYIVDHEKLSIPAIFKTKGEEYFRAAESSCLGMLLQDKKSLIVSVGGGTPCYNNNMKLMQNGGKVVYLKASPQTLAKRLEQDETERPLFNKLKGKQLLEKVESMLSHRKKFYEQAPIIFDTQNRTVEEIGKQLKGLLL